ncbi:hypothetical protein [Kineothrix sedimenti]|uniref:Tail fiber-like repeat protein n=1 Tax=Kineothrix sedimenti TaxID=3123317 RepID=A0ABZ3EZX4_9FIRM
MEAVAINKTPNLNLQKPTSDELYSVQVQNTNMDILDSTIKTMQNTDATLAKQTDLESHINNKDNPHAVTKEQIGLSNVVNQRQIPAVQTTVTDNGIPVFNGNGNSLKDSGFTIGKSVPEDAIFTDTVYTHPISGVIPNTYKSVTVDERGHVVDGTNPTTLSGYGITDAATIDHTHATGEILASYDLPGYNSTEQFVIPQNAAWIVATFQVFGSDAEDNKVFQEANSITLPIGVASNWGVGGTNPFYLGGIGLLFTFTSVDQIKIVLNVQGSYTVEGVTKLAAGYYKDDDLSSETIDVNIAKIHFIS